MIHFEANIIKVGDWTLLRLPKDVSAKLPSRGQAMIKGTVNGSHFQTALEPDGEGSHWFNVDKPMQKALGVGVGDKLTLDVESTKEWPEPEVPAAWKTALHAHPQANAVWQDITPMARWEWIRWLRAPQNPEIRERRIGVACSKLSKGDRRPCCFNARMCTIPDISKNGVLLEATDADRALES